jgi:hypothetical protein
MALAMSRAFGRFSLQVQQDIYDAIAAQEGGEFADDGN